MDWENSRSKFFRHLILAIGLIWSSGLYAAAEKCEDVLNSQGAILNVHGRIPDGIMVFNQSPEVINFVSQLVKNSRIKPQPELIPGFNHRIKDSTAETLDKYIRSQTPSTVRMMVAELLRNVSGIEKFQQLGIVVGDPHNGNLNTQAEPFSRRRGKNTYRVVDLDEVSVGIMLLDFARYVIYIKANMPHGNLGERFEADLVQAYISGLRRETQREIPEFIRRNLERTPEQVLEKITRYAENRLNGQGKFKKSLYEKEELMEFKTINMKPEFLNLVNFDRKNGDRKAFKETLERMMSDALKASLGNRIEILDIAIPFRDTGGSANMQRFLVSVEVTTGEQKRRLVVEFKQNTERAGWEATIDSPLQSAADRYSLAMHITSDEVGPLSAVTTFGASSFLVRVKGGDDIEYSRRQEEELAVFNAYFMGLFHGSQGRDVSLPYISAVVTQQRDFRDVLMRVVNRVTEGLIRESGNGFRE